jgi:hypothetical protein
MVSQSVGFPLSKVTVLLGFDLFIRLAFLAFWIILKHGLDRRIIFFFRAEQGGNSFFTGNPLIAPFVHNRRSCAPLLE